MEKNICSTSNFDALCEQSTEEILRIFDCIEHDSVLFTVD